jgi:RNA polymerase sigma-70 factor (ECF subfamily)
MDKGSGPAWAGGPETAPGEIVYSTHAERQQAFLQLLEPQLSALSRFCRSMCRDDMDAEDLASETVLRAWQHFERIESPAAFLSFLFTIASREFRRDRKRRSIWTTIGSLTASESIDRDPSPDAGTDVHYLHLALVKLPAKYREAIVLAEIVGMKLEEVAEIQASSLTAVKSRVSRGKKKLAKLLGVEEHRAIEARAPLPVPMRNDLPPRPDVHPRLAFFSKEKLL